MKSLQRNPKIIAREVDGETILLNEKKEQIHQLNHTASFIWKSCNGKNTIDDIVKLLKEEFQTESGDIETDVNNTIASFKKLNLLEE